MQFIIVIIIIGLYCGAVCGFTFQRTCSHNDRPGVSSMDMVEHIGNGEYGSIIRDYHDVYKGDQYFTGFDNNKPESQPQRKPEKQQPNQEMM